MQSRIDSSLTADERRILGIYSDAKFSGIGHATRLSIQYAIGTGVFIVLCLEQQEPLYILPVYGTFLLFMFLRIRGAKKLAGIMPALIRKYEARIAELETR